MSMIDQRTSDRYPAPPSARSNGRALTIAGGICAVVALFFLPIVFGPIGAVLAFVGYSRGYKPGLWVGIAAVAATVIGLVLAAWVLSHAPTAPAR
jgi:hypothetical protein